MLIELPRFLAYTRGYQNQYIRAKRGLQLLEIFMGCYTITASKYSATKLRRQISVGEMRARKIHRDR